MTFWEENEDLTNKKLNKNIRLDEQSNFEEKNVGEQQNFYLRCNLKQRKQALFSLVVSLHPPGRKHQQTATYGLIFQPNFVSFRRVRVKRKLNYPSQFLHMF